MARKILFRIFLVFFTTLILLWAIVSFVEWSISPSNWVKDARLTVGVILGIITFMGAVITCMQAEADLEDDD